MKITAIMNMKGGTGKTVTTVNAAAILARDYGQKVLVVDADSQANTTAFLAAAPLTGRTLADLLRLSALERTAFSLSVTAAEAVRETNLPNVSLLPADASLMDLDLSKVESGTAFVNCLRELRSGLEAHGYTQVLVDCPPAFNAAAAAALLAADQVVIPMKLDAWSIQGMANLMRQIYNMQRINPTLHVAGILPTMWYHSDKILSAERELRSSELPIYPHIRRSSKVDDMTYLQKPLIYSSPKSGACHDYKTFVARFVKGGVIHGV